MSGHGGADHPSRGPGWAWLLGAITVVFGGTQLFDTGLGRAISIATLSLAALTAWRIFPARGVKRYVLIVTAGASLICWAIAAIAIPPGGNPSASGSVSPPQESYSPTTPEAASSSPTWSPTSVTTPSTTRSLPPPVVGAKAPTKELKTGQSAEFFASGVRVGMGDALETYAFMVIESEVEACSAVPDVGESVVLAAEPAPDGVDGQPISWFRVTVLGIRGSVVDLRVERLAAVERPLSSAQCT